MIKKMLNGVLAAGWYATHPSALKSAIEPASGKTLSLTNTAGWPVSANYTGKAINELTALQIASAWACVRLISETMGTLPLKVYKRGENGAKERDPDHPLHWLLSVQPAIGMSPISFREALGVSLCVHGQAYILPERMDSTGNVVTLTPLPATAVEPIIDSNRDATNRPLGWRVTLNGRPREYALDEILSVTGWGGTGYQGFSPYEMHSNALGIAAAADEYAARYFSEHATPGVVLKYGQKLNQEQRELIRKMWKEQHAGLVRSREPAILELGIDMQTVSHSMKDAQAIETRNQQVQEVARIWRVPPTLVGDMSKATFNNVEQMNRQFLQHTLAPYLMRVEQALTRGLLSPADRRTHFVEFDTGGLLMADAKTRAEVQRIEILSGTLTINEARAMNNRPPVEGGDRPLVQTNMIGLDELDELTGANDNQDEAA